QPRWFESGWYRIVTAWPKGAGAAPEIMLTHDGAGERERVYPMVVMAGMAEGIVAIAQGHYWLRLGPGHAGDMVVERIGRRTAVRAMWAALSAPVEDGARPQWFGAACRILPGLRHGPRGLIIALVDE